MIHIEGCDGTGKSTLSEFLSEKLGWEIVKFSQPKTDNPFQEYLDFFEENKGKNLILDRSWIGETIYGPLKRGSGLTTEQRNILIKMTKDDLYIIAHTKPSVIKNVFETRGEDFINIEEAKKINQKFFNKAKVLGKKLNVLLYDFTYNGTDLESYFNNYIKNKLKN